MYGYTTWMTYIIFLQSLTTKIPFPWP